MRQYKAVISKVISNQNTVNLHAKVDLVQVLVLVSHHPPLHHYHHSLPLHRNLLLQSNESALLPLQILQLLQSMQEQVVVQSHLTPSQLIVGNAGASVAIVAAAAPVIVAAAAAPIINAEPVNQADIDTEPEDWRR